MENIKTRYVKYFDDYSDRVIDYVEFKERLKVLDDETETKQGNLPLNKKEVKS